MAISVGSVEVDVVPNTQGIYGRLRAGLEPAATRAAEEAGASAGRAFGRQMRASVPDTIGAQIGQQLGNAIGARITAQMRDAVRAGVTQGGQQARGSAARQGEETAGAFARTMRARLEQAYRSMPQINVTMATSRADAQLAHLRERMQALASRRIGVDLDAERALAEVAAIEEGLQRLGASHPNVAVRADTGAALAHLAAVRAAVAAVDAEDVDVDVRPAIRSFSALTTAVAAFGPAAIPVVAGAAAAVGALASAFAAAGAGAAAFALAVKPQLTQVQKARQLHTAYADAVARSGKDSDAAKTALAAYTAQMKSLPPASRSTAAALDRLKGANQKWSDSLAKTTMPVFTRAIDAAAAALPKFTPLVKAGAGAVGDLVGRAAGWASGGGLSRMVAWLVTQAGPQIRAFGRIAANIFGGIGGALRAFAPAASSATAALVRLTARFREWGQSGDGVRSLLGYVQRSGPGVAQMLGNLGGAVLNVVAALAPLGGTATSFLNAVAAGIRAIPTPVLTVLGVAFASVAIGMKLAAAALAIWRAASAAAGVVTAVLTGQTLALNAAMRANVIGIIITLIAALVVAVIYAWNHWTGFRNVVMAAWSGIQTAAAWAWNNVLRPAFEGIKAALSAVGAAASWLWTTILQPVFGFIGAAARILATIIAFVVAGPIILAVRAVGAIFSWLWANVVQPVAGWIGGRVTWLYQNVIRPNIALMRAAISALGAGFSWLWANVVQPVLGWIGARAAWLWNNAIRPSFALLRSGLNAVGSAFSWLWKTFVQPVLGWIGDKASWLWRNALKPAFDLIGRGVSAVGRSFEDAKNFIGRAWSKLEDIAKKPVRFIIGTVYNKGIVPTWNLIARAFGAPEIDPMNIKGWATGGVLPGYTPGRDVHLAALSGGEAIMRPEWTRAVGPGYVDTMNAAARRGGVGGVRQMAAGALPAFADGGIFGWIGSAASAVKGWGSAAWDKVKGAASWLGETIEASARAGVKHIVDPLLARLPGADTGFGKMIRRIPTKALDAIFGYGKKADKLVTPNIAYKAGAGVAQWRPVVLAALREAGQSASLANITLARMQQESGGNPNIVNKWDSNWQAGHPSVGLMQVIGPTFRSHAGKYRTKGPFLYGTSVDPMANIYASMKYALSAYGSLSRAYGRPGGYDSGGYLQPGLNLAYNGTGKPEPVLTTQQMNSLTGAAVHGSDKVSSSQPMQFEGNLILDSGEFLGAVHGVVQQHDKQLAQMLRAGRRT